MLHIHQLLRRYSRTPDVVPFSYHTPLPGVPDDLMVQHGPLITDHQPLQQTTSV